MSLQDKISSAKPTTFLTNGLSEEEVKQAVDEGRKRRRMKLIIDMHQEQYEFIKQGMSIDKVMQFPALMEAICGYIANGTPLDDVKAVIKAEMNNLADIQSWGRYYGLGNALSILDNIGKESEE